MTLLLSKTWKHALFAATVKEAAYARQPAFLGRKVFQKMVYFLTVWSVHIRNCFEAAAVMVRAFFGDRCKQA